MRPAALGKPGMAEIIHKTKVAPGAKTQPKFASVGPLDGVRRC